MINMQAARELKKELMEGFTSGGMKAAEALITSIEDDYGELSPTGPLAPTTIRDWQKAIHVYAQSKGWWDPEKPRGFGEICALFHTEVSEAFEEYRAGHPVTEVYEKENKPEGVPVELADLVIRVLDYCQWAGIDLQTVMEKKHQYNLGRSYRHGGKLA
jgi:NTP pyrophosphatase (non-canonical NTP hydrolase)